MCEYVGNVDRSSCSHFASLVKPTLIEHDRREQYQQEKLHVPPLVKLHEVHSLVILLLFPDLFQAFILLEQEIEDALPKFQELIHALQYVLRFVSSRSGLLTSALLATTISPQRRHLQHVNAYWRRLLSMMR